MSLQTGPRSPATLVGVVALLVIAAFSFETHQALAQSTIPPNLTQLRPIKGIAYDPKPSDFFQDAYFDSDFWNTDFPAIWGTGDNGRNDLGTFTGAGLNLLHLYNWNAQRIHTPFLDAAQVAGLKVMVPISNFTAQTIVNQTGCCPGGYQAAFNIVRDIFNQIYLNGSTTPHPAAAMWGIFNEYDLNKIDPANVVFVMQAILMLENQRNVPAANRLPITVPVSDATFDRAHRQALSPQQATAFEKATLQWLQTNPGKNVNNAPSDLPGAVLAILALSITLQETSASGKTQYGPAFIDTGPVTVAPVPTDFWKTRFIASSNPFRLGPALRDFVTSPAQFQSAWPGTTVWNTLPPLFFSEMGRSQVDSGGATTPPTPSVLQKQAADVLVQIQCTNPLAVSGGTPQGYFLGSAFFQHTFVDTAHYEAFAFGPFTTRTTKGAIPDQTYRLDSLNALPQWVSVQSGYGQNSATCP